MNADPETPATHSKGLIIGAVVAQIAGLAVGAFCLFMAEIVTFGLFGGNPQLDPVIVLPLLGVAVATPLGPLVMALGPRRGFWLRVAAATSFGFVLLVSLLTWAQVATGLA